MSGPATRAQFINYCKRSLGHPVIEINVDDDQVEDRVDEALEFWQDYHFDGAEKLYLRHLITQDDHDRRYLIIPDRIIGVTGIMDIDGSASSINMFDLRYQLRLHDLYDFTSVSYVPYTITMQHLRTMQLLFSGTPMVRFHRHRNRLMLDVNWESDVPVGTYVIIECYGKISGDRVAIQGDVSVTANSSIVTGTNFDTQLLREDELVITTGTGNVTTRVTRVNSNSSVTVSATFSNTESGLAAYIPDNSDVWNDRVLKELATLYIKKQWGQNLSKFSGIQMPGGVLLNGDKIYNDAVTELEKLKADFISYNTQQSDFLVGGVAAVMIMGGILWQLFTSSLI